MSTSALKLITGVIDGKSIRNNVNQAGHGFTAGSVVRYDVNHSNGDGGFTAAKAISSMEAEVSGIVERVVDSSTFVLVYQGEIGLTDITTTGNTADEVYFLSSETAGNLTTNPPTIAGHVIKPVLVRRSDTSGLVMNYLGTVIGGEATVSLDGLVPVGTIYPYAGASSDVPAGWSVCDGGTLETARYPEVYPRISWNYGVTQKLTLTDNSGNIADLSSVSVGDVVEQDIHRPCGMPGDNCPQGGIGLVETVAKGTVVSKDTAEGTIHVSVQVTDEVSGNISTGPLFNNTTTDEGGTRPGNLKVADGFTFQVTKNEVEYVHKPDLRSRVPVGANHGDTSRTQSIEDILQQKWYRGKIGGQAAHQLIEEELPSGIGGAVEGTATVDIAHTHGSHSHSTDISTGTATSDSTATLASNGQLGVESKGYHLHGDIPNPPMKYFPVTSGSGLNLQTQPSYTVSTTTSLSGSISSSGTTIELESSDDTDKTIDHDFSVSINGLGQNHNNMQPYLVTEYIIRISSEARAALVTGIDVNLSLEGLNNVADNAPAVNEMIRHSGSVYEKITPNIDGLSTKDNKDLVVHTSQSAAGATLEHMRISTTGKIFIGATQGSTADMPTTTRAQLIVKNTQSDAGSYAFFQGQGAGQVGSTGTFIGHVAEQTVIWNASAHSTRPSRNTAFYFKDSGGNSVVAARVNHNAAAIGGNTPRFGCSLDVQGGNFAVAGDIYTYGATQGVFASVLGVTATLGGYNLPVTAGVSGEVLMVHGSGKTLGFFAQAAPTVLWSGDAATGASCSAVNVAIGTGGNGAGTAIGKMGATLEVGGGALVHGGLTVGGPLQIGIGQAHNTNSQMLLSAISSTTNAFAELKSTSGSVALELDPATGQGAYLSFMEGNSKRGQIHHQGNEDRMKISAHDGSGYITAIEYDMDARVALGNDSAIDTDYLVSTGTAGTSGGFFSRAGVNLFGVGASSGVINGNGSSPVQVLRSGTGKTGAYVQIGSAHFGVSAGTFIGEGVGGHSEIQALADTGGTLDFHVGKATGSTLAMKIHNGGLVQIGATAGGGAVAARKNEYYRIFRIDNLMS